MESKLKNDYDEFKKTKPFGGIGGPIDSTLKNWEVIIPGPLDSPFEGGKFKIGIQIKDNYPDEPPECKFITKVFHPNINFKTGSICVNFLKAPYNSEPNEKRTWSNKKSICEVIVGLWGLLLKPNVGDPLNRNAYDLYHSDKHRYNELAKCFTKKFAMNN